MTTLTVAVHGATGVQGSHLAARIRAAGHDVRPLTSANADLRDVDMLVRAYTGADAVVVQLPQVFEPDAFLYAESVLSALGKAGVPRAVFNAGAPLPPAPVGAPYVDARIALAADLPARVERAATLGPAGPYLENLLMPWSVRRVREAGELAYPLPAAAPVGWLALDDLGDLVAALLTDPEPPARRIVTGPAPLTGDDLAAELAAATGRPVRYTPVSPAEYRELIAPVIGASAAAGIAGFYEQAASAPPPPAPPTGLLHAGRTTVAQWAARQDWAG